MATKHQHSKAQSAAIRATIEAMGTLGDVDKACIDEGFTDGNYSSAYEYIDYDTAHKMLNGVNGFYRIGHLLGFFSSYETHEVPQEWREQVEHYRAVMELLEVEL